MAFCDNCLPFFRPYISRVATRPVGAGAACEGLQSGPPAEIFTPISGLTDHVSTGQIGRADVIGELRGKMCEQLDTIVADPGTEKGGRDHDNPGRG